MLSGFHAEATVGVQGRQFAIHHIARCELAEQAPLSLQTQCIPIPPRFSIFLYVLLILPYCRLLLHWQPPLSLADAAIHHANTWGREP